MESLQKGVIKSSKDKAKAPYTILLLGETGVGKSSFLELIANVLAGNDIDHYNFDILDYTNEQGGSNNQSQTNSTCLYELMSKNGMEVCSSVCSVMSICNLFLRSTSLTPGLTDTHNIEQDQSYRKRIATQIKRHTESVTAVLVLASGAVPRSTVGIDSTLSIFFRR